MTIGKKLGLIVFIISQVLVVVFSILYIICTLKKIETDITAASILTFEGSVFVTVWTATATKKFAPLRENKE